MYLAVTVEIIFPECRDRNAFKTRTVNSFRIESSWRNLTDTAEIVFSKTAAYGNENIKKFSLSTALKVGDPIIIKGGYNQTLFNEFTGFVSEISDDLNFVIKCEDNMYSLKRIPVNKSYASVTLEKLLRDIVPIEFEVEAMDVELGSLYFSNTTVSQVLVQLKEDFGLYAYFDEKKLVSGKIYTDNTQRVKYKFSKNIIENDLRFQFKNDVKLKVTMTSHLSNGKKIKVTVGDTDGEEQNLVCSNVSNKSQIEKLAQSALSRLKVDGYKGSLTTLGFPFVRHGYTAEIKNDLSPAKNGAYYVDAVTTSLSDMGAYRRVVSIGKKAAN